MATGGFRWKPFSLIQEFRRFERIWGDRRRPLRLIGQFVVETSKQAFDNEQDPTTGHKWPSLSPEYAAYKRKQRRSGKMLVFRAHLKRSVAYSITMPRVTIGPSVHYGIHHQFGTQGGSLGRSGGSTQKLPARPFLGLSKQDENDIQAIVSRFVAGKR